MGVAVLHPQGCLRNPSSSRQTIISASPKMKIPNPNTKPTRSSRSHPKRPKRSQDGSDPTRPNLKPQVNNLVTGQVKILKRGEQLTELAANRKPKTVEKEFREKPDLGSTEPLDPKPEVVPTEKATGLYAGYSLFVASPPPSSVPLPAFFTKKTNAATVSDATSDLRRILRLDYS